MTRANSRTSPVGLIMAAVCALLILCCLTPQAQARNPYRGNFFDAYPSAVGSVLDDVPSQAGHCGVCHFDFGGGGTRNPFGLAVEATDRSVAAILGLDGLDSDGDGFSNGIEITDTVNFVNTPTFPGLTPANLASVSNVDLADIQPYLLPSTGGDTTPPTVSLTAPNGGETLVANSGTTVQWFADDASGIATIDLYVSLDNGATFKPVAQSLSNTGSHTWFPANRPTVQAVFRAVATDNAFNEAQDDSDAVFTIESPPGGIVPSTLRDFDQPGSQPFEAGILNPPEACEPCHGNYNTAFEPYYNWQGSMMAQASRDLIFLANMTIANQDAPDSGDMCLRCHFPRGWLQGRSIPTDGSQMLDTDESGVSCDFCHRLVDPIYSPGENPSEDQAILAALSFPGTEFGNGMAVIDPTGARRGPFLNADSGHPILVSPFHREAALCGTCHNVSNPAFENDGSGNFVPNAFDTTSTTFSPHSLMPVERTYSEWFYSQYNTQAGVYGPQFGGNKDYVATCQDCHMHDVTGEGCNFGTPPTRDDLPLHDITGGSTWFPGLLNTLFPGEVNDAALQDGILRARYMLQNAADMSVEQQDRDLLVTVVNNTGHKLPTGYPEGRRIWINVKFYDDTPTLIAESGAYDSATGYLSHDAEAKIYHTEPGMDEVVAPLAGVPPGPSFHFVLNNKIFLDNRIPPLGFSNADYGLFGGSPVDYVYADGQYWDVSSYAIPAAAASVDVTLYYQSTSKEFIEFLRDENTTDTKGQEMYDLWNINDKCPPEMMAQAQLALVPPVAGDYDGDGQATLADYAQFPACMTGPGGLHDPGCEPFDCNRDLDVDLDDFSEYQFALYAQDIVPPAVPTGLLATGDDTFITLDWDDNADADLAGYNVLRSTNSGGPYLKMNAAPLATSDFTDTGLSNGLTYYYVVTAVDTASNESGPGGEAGATSQPAGGNIMHVESIVPTIDDQGGGNKYAVVTVTILDDLGLPVEGADVTGTFSGQYTGTFTETTDVNGVAVLIAGPKNGGTAYTFCVDNVVHATLTYDPGANVETCDSGG
ncbi:MAG TPA: Ig-like domain-containing protein [Phycisphaerae bacterium]|nr:Ig-like domain-containing protein [Phycisphaerae bacterium]